MKLLILSFALLLFSCKKETCSRVVESVPCLVCETRRDKPVYRNTLENGSTVITSQPHKIGDIICQ